MFVSILGDSISTYRGFNPNGYAVYYDEEMQMRNGLQSVYDTWWAKVNQELNAFLCVNNSYSGSMVSGEGFPSGHCHERLMNMHTSEQMPDLILIYMGFNDFGYGVPIGCAPMSNNGKTNLQFFEDAYHQMLIGLRYYYPKAKIISATLLKTTLKHDKFWQFPSRLSGICIDEYNDAIRRAADNCHIDLADIAKCHFNITSLAKRDSRYETLDGTHPTAKGHQTIADEWVTCLAKIL